MFLPSLFPMLMLAGSWTSWAQDPQTFLILAKYQKTVDQGLEWLAKQQKKDGRWVGLDGAYPIPMTALAGLALLAEGSTPTQGKYQKHLDKAVEYLLDQAQKDGLIGDLQDRENRSRYMFGHGFALTFLTQVYVKEKDAQIRKKLEKVIERALEFTDAAQTTTGGWGYVSAGDGNDFSENIVTVPQFQSLLAARQAGFRLPKGTLEATADHVRKSSVLINKEPDDTKREVGVTYSLSVGGGPRPTVTAGVLACWMMGKIPGEVGEGRLTRWLNYAQRNIRLDLPELGRSFNVHEYLHFYYAQALYRLGEDGHAKLRPDLAEAEKAEKDKKHLLKWSRYREAVFPSIAARQKQDGSWDHGWPVYTTSVYLIILQLDKGHLPMCRR